MPVYKLKMLPLFLFFVLFIAGHFVRAQQQSNVDVENLKREVLQLQMDVKSMKLNLGTAEKKFKRGMLVATIGYSVTITGGLMLGRKNDDLGKVLLVAGGTTGVIGTVMMLNAFKHLGKG